MDSFIQWALGQSTNGSSHLLSRWIFLRSLGAIYLIAFVSFWVQVKGLIGRKGILPAESFFSYRTEPFSRRPLVFPAIFWLHVSDAALSLACAGGVFFSLLLILGIAPMAALLVLWILYSSLVVSGQDFTSFQWDILLLETGFLAIFFAPLTLLPGLHRETAVSPLILGLLWFLLFRLMFESGVGKVTSGDESWRDLSALTFHYETQPLPTWIGWYMHQMPASFHRLSVVIMYVVEIFLPFLIFAPSPFRLGACLGLILFQVLILVAGNYNFFNLLTIALCLLLPDDSFWLSILPASLVGFLDPPALASPLPRSFLYVALPFSILVVFVGSLQLFQAFSPRTRTPNILRRAAWGPESLRIVNSYGLFRVMTRTRPEIIVEGSDDGGEWKAYEFRYKPGDLRKAPPFVEPHQPRLDWQVWFAALSHYDYTFWFQSFLIRLLEASPDVIALLAGNPFPDRPPRYVRAVLYNYRFTDLQTKRATGEWWRREPIGPYSPVLTLK